MREEIVMRYGVLENENDSASSLVRTWQASELWRRAPAPLFRVRHKFRQSFRIEFTDFRYMQYSSLLVLEAEMRFRLAVDTSHRNPHLVSDSSGQNSLVRLWGVSKSVPYYECFDTSPAGETAVSVVRPLFRAACRNDDFGSSIASRLELRCMGGGTA
jgi:hypothetical protein